MTWDKTHLVDCDPCLAWADASTREGVEDDAAPDIAVLVELIDGESVMDRVSRINDDGLVLRMVPNQLPGGYPTLFVTAIVNRAASSATALSRYLSAGSPSVHRCCSQKAKRGCKGQHTSGPLSPTSNARWHTMSD